MSHIICDVCWFYREYKAVVPEDLYYSLQVQLNQAGKTGLLGGYNVSTILTSWDSFKGYPIVNIRRIYENGSLILTQVSFLFIQFILILQTLGFCLIIGKVFPKTVYHKQRNPQLVHSCQLRFQF